MNYGGWSSTRKRGSLGPDISSLLKAFGHQGIRSLLQLSYIFEKDLALILGEKEAGGEALRRFMLQQALVGRGRYRSFSSAMIDKLKAGLADESIGEEPNCNLLKKENFFNIRSDEDG